MEADRGHVDELQRAHRRLSGDDYGIDQSVQDEA